MNLQILAQNIRQWRMTRGYSQKVLAEKAGISLPTIKNLELSKSEPRMKTVQAIAKALDVRLNVLFQPVRQLKTVRFRSSNAKKIQHRANILAEVSKWLDDFNSLEELLNDKIAYKLGEKCEKSPQKNPAEIASLCRQKLGLGPLEPIHNICGLMENSGIKVHQINIASNYFFGLSIAQEDGGPAIIVNTWSRIPVERRIFSVAHELGHIILHRHAFDISQIKENQQEEREANLFAGHFLMSNEAFLKEWNSSSGLYFIDRVFKVKRIFRVSYKSILYRLIELNLADNSIWKNFNYLYQQRFERKQPFKKKTMGLISTEPLGLKSIDFQEDRFNRLVREALELDKISLSRAAEILGISLQEMLTLFHNWELVK